MDYIIDVLAHTWKGWPLMAVVFIGLFWVASVFVCVSAFAASWFVEWMAHLDRRRVVVLRFEPSRGLYHFRPERVDESTVISFQEKESVH